MSKFGTSSEKNLVGVNPLLVKVMRAAIIDTPIDFRILDGLRTLAEQKRLVKKGASKTMKSRHLSGKAVDIGALVNGKICWEVPLYKKLADHILKHAKAQNVKLTWGGSWEGFPDYGHFELDKTVYGY